MNKKEKDQLDMNLYLLSVQHFSIYKTLSFSHVMYYMYMNKYIYRIFKIFILEMGANGKRNKCGGFRPKQ